MTVVVSNRTRTWLGRLVLATLLLAVPGCGSDNLVNIVFGTLSVETATFGSNLDANAYNLAVTGPSLSVNQTIGVNDQVIFSVTPGSYSARLSDVAGNCTVETNPLNAAVSGGITARLMFQVSCT